MSFLLPFVSLPTPYAGLTVVDIPSDRLARLPAFPFSVQRSGFPVVKPLLLNASRFAGLASIIGAETMVASDDGKGLTLLDRTGVMHLATADGLIVSSRHIGIVGRPLGFAYDAQGRLVICDSVAGLLRFDPRISSTEILANTLSDGTPLHFINDLSISKNDGKIYFTSSVARPVVSWHNSGGFFDTMHAAKMNLIHGEPSGRLLMYDPATKRVEQLLDGLFFSNGVALSPSEDFVLVCETYGARVMRVWLRGPYAGTFDVFVEGLPGYPDGIASRDGGGYWVALINPPNALAWAAGSRIFRAMAAHLMPLLELFVKRWGCIAELSPDGDKVALLTDITGDRVQSIASVHQHGRRLILGNLMGAGVSYLALKELE
eukprot:CAMPEP_0119330146 /NCGR_PEP_ID=MMETSP1333-20130426/77624_1 /TAXON_ID=418940 /ORGANISM="Scyphosphaera apsteinii, Strain RCC1455" /LENGTH=374 /DNA_ID=CAMNT_0007339467 /DNA_START=178 /DNA_END=1302 /DNA_ORIENTATION=+